MLAAQGIRPPRLKSPDAVCHRTGPSRQAFRVPARRPAPGAGDLRHRGRGRAGPEDRIGDSFVRAVQLMLDVRGRVVVMGMGKSGHIGRKIAATLASTGTPAMFVHPAEASHGDLGMIKPIDLVLAISNGGESDEITAILPVLKRLGVPLVAMTGNPRSPPGAPCRHRAGQRRRQGSLPAEPGAHRQHHRAAGAGRCAGRGAARCARLPAEDFARSHPGGALGRKLLTHLSDVMRSGDAVPRVLPDASFPT
jgi:arabinose-5-phosphate isomerase